MDELIIQEEDKKAIAFIAKRIEEGKCILIIGPDVSVSSADKSVNELLKDYLDTNFTSPLKYYSDDEFFSFANETEKDFAFNDIKEFYTGLEPNEIHYNIAEIPFHLIISISPDHLLKKAFDEKKFNYGFDFYNKEQNIPKVKKFDKNRPLIYNLFGDIDTDVSLVFTYEDLFEYLISISGKFELPKDIQNELASARLVLLLGIKFEKWYFKLLLRILRLHKTNYNRAAEKIRNLLPTVKNFYAEEFKVQFLGCEEIDIVSSIYKECESKGLLRSQNPLVLPQEQEIFVSYGWEPQSEKIVANIAELLADKGYKLQVDKIVLGYKGNIKQFMQSIGRGKYIVVVISDKYLKSENCMYEILEIKKHNDFYNSIFPVVLSDAKIYDEGDRIDYINHWDTKIEELKLKIKTIINPVGTKQVLEKLDQYADIRRAIDEITDTLRNMNTLTPDMHADTQFSGLLLALEQQIKNNTKL